eukprot:gene8221-8891_t
MKTLFIVVCVCILCLVANAFHLQRNVPSSSRRSLAMNEAATATTTTSKPFKYFFYNQKFNPNPLKNKLSNMSRKIRRHLKSATSETFEKLIYTSEYDNFLKNSASENVYKVLMQKIQKTALLMQKIQKTARQLNIKLKADFGKRVKAERPDIVSTAVSAGTFTKLVDAVKAAGLAESLQKGLLTVFAPSDEAFAQLPEGALEGLLSDIPKLQRLLKNHVIDGTYSGKKLLGVSGQGLKTLADTELKIKAGRGENSILVGDAEVTKTNIKCSNGYIHVINTVLLPKD